MAQSGADDSRKAEHIEALISQVAAFPDAAARTQMQELVRALLDLYGDALARMLELTAEAPSAGDSLIEAFASDELVRSLLLLHGLHPLDTETRVRRAVDDARAYVERHGGSVELLGIVDDVARVRLRSGGASCSASAQQLQDTVEALIYAAAPELEEVRIEGSIPSSRLITLSRAPRRAGASRPVR
jgi:Fe-S cluster biogenesis protein NfuA